MGYGDLISRQAAIDAFDGVKVDEENCTEYDIGYNDGIDYAVSRLSVLPSAEPEQTVLDDGTLVVEVDDHKAIKSVLVHSDWGATCFIEQPERKKGKWIDLKCDQCGQVDMSKPNFCPNCGADMRGE